MRFYEFESRIRACGHPRHRVRFAKTAAEAEQAAKKIGGPTVVKSQVLTGGA